MELIDRFPTSPGYTEGLFVLGDSLFKSGGTAIVLHAAGDDYKTNPAGAAGARIACGVITK